MIDIMEEKKSSVLRVLTNISEAKSQSDVHGNRFKDSSDSPLSFEEIKVLQSSKKISCGILQKKNQLHPLFANHPYRCASMYLPRASTSRPKLKDVSQRIVSAKLLQIKELRNQLTLTQHQLNEVTNENRFLKTLQKRQEVALRKYEGQEARLPQLIQSHNEEIRILTSKIKQMKQTNQRLVEKLKAAEQQLTSLQEQHCHLVAISRNQQLGERETLTNQVLDLQHALDQQNNTIQLLTRKVDLERKNYKHELGTEKNKRIEVEKKLSLAMQTIENLKDQIEAKEKCMSSIVPSRYVRTTHAPCQPSQPSRLAHSQIPRTPLSLNNNQSVKNPVDPPCVTRRSSTDQTGNETDNGESQNGHNTSDSTRTTNSTTLPKIKPQITNRNLRNQYKLTSKRLGRPSNEENLINNITPDYSSSFTSVENLKDLKKDSESESEKLMKAKRQLVMNSQAMNTRGRKFSVDSGVMNKSESGKMTQRTDQSSESSSRTRRNSISVCPTTGKDMERYLEQDSLTAKLESHKSIRDELKELEEKLLQGCKLLDKTRKQKGVNTDAEESVKEITKGMVDSPRNTGDDGSDEQVNFNEVNWNEIHSKIKAESEAAEAKLEEYYSTLEKSELNLEDTENYIALEEEQKERLLRALKEIDKEAHGVSSSSSADETKLPSSRKPTRRKSDGCRYSNSKSIDNLHRGRPVYDKVKIPVVEKMRQEEKEYLASNESGRKNKSDFMKDLFGNYEEEDDNEEVTFPPGKEDMERLVLGGSFD